MIHFACRCGHRFSLPDDLAGTTIQCPNCHLLRDIPTPDELANVAADGGYTMSDVVPRIEPIHQRVDEATRAFTRDRFDEKGEEIDLRPTIEDVLRVGVPSETTSIAENVAVDRPQYDPLTGELVRPMNIAPRAPAATAEPETIPVIAYAHSGLNRIPRWTEIPALLCRPINLFVMALILFGHLLIQPFNVMMLAGLYLMAPLWLIAWGLIAAQYANVVDEIGPADRDELPRPIRDASLRDDIWLPFTHTCGAILICFGPLILLRQNLAPDPLLWLAFLGGSMIFPAVFLTMATSGSTLNLRPDRVANVARAIGPRYLIYVAMVSSGLVAYYLGLWRFEFDSVLVFVSRSTAQWRRASVPWWFQPWVTYPLLCGAIFTLHWFCWALGLEYRRYHNEFNWVLQRHEFVRLKQRLVRKKPPIASE